MRTGSNLKFYIILLIIHTATSCSINPLTILVDPWWETAVDSGGFLKREIFIQNIRSLNRIKKYTASNEEEAIQFLQNLSESSEKQTVIITPIFYSILRKTSSDEKIINYIILNGFYDDPGRPD